MRTTILEIAKARELIRSDDAGTLNCLIGGESGTGKEGIAGFLHLCRQGVSRGAFIPIDCTAFPEHLLESELFGSMEGSFTGAVDREGLLKSAGNGTVFLDEIGLMPLSLQAKLLRFIETRTYRKLGANDTTHVPNCRVIAATSRNLDEAVREDRFLVDLYNRLRAVTITIPPLRQRREDVLPLVAAYAPGVVFTPEATALLFDYHWEGNIRELRQVAERYKVRAKGSSLPLVVTLSTLLEDWPQSVAKDYIESALRWRWAIRELAHEGRKRVYFDILQERQRSGQLAADLEAIQERAAKKDTWSVFLTNEEIQGGEALKRAEAGNPTSNDLAVYRTILKTRFKDGSFGRVDEDPTWHAAIEEVDRQNQGNDTRSADQMGLSRSTYVSRKKQHLAENNALATKSGSQA